MIKPHQVWWNHINRSSRHHNKDNKPINGKMIKHVYHILLTKDFSGVATRVEFVKLTTGAPSSHHKFPPQGPGCCLEKAAVPLSAVLFPPRQRLGTRQGQAPGNPGREIFLASCRATPSTLSNHTQTFRYPELPASYWESYGDHTEVENIRSFLYWKQFPGDWAVASSLSDSGTLSMDIQFLFQH